MSKTSILRIRWFLLALVLVMGGAYSQQHVQDKKQPTESKQTGTEKQPFVVKIAPTSKTEAEAKQEKEDRDAKQRAEERKQKAEDDLATFTGQVANYTNLLFL